MAMSHAAFSNTTQQSCVQVQSTSIEAHWVDETMQKSERPELGAARVVISGIGPHTRVSDNHKCTC